MDTVNENATFDENDVFQRVEVAKKAMGLIANHQNSRGACVIDIDAPWGMGKTTLLKMWINELEREDDRRQYNVFSSVQNACVYYNAWENDYYEEALSPLIYTICGSIYIKANKTDKWASVFKDKLSAIVAAGAGVLTSFFCYRDTGNSVLAAGMGGMVTGATNAAFHLIQGQDSEELGKQYSDEIEKRKAFHDAVSNLAESCGKLFVFIDELDRCKPTFAIQTLECIKHYFNIPNVVFVFATDMSQLAHTVEGYYGHGMDAGGYFLKFFDYILHLPISNVRELMEYAHQGTKVDEAYYSYFNEIRKVFCLTPRETPWIIKRTHAVWQSAFAGHRKVNLSASFAFIAFIISIKTKMPNRFSNWLVNQDDLTDLFSSEDQTFIGRSASFLHRVLTISTYDLEDKISKSDERETRRRIDGIEERQVDYEDVFLHTIYAVCAPQTAVSQTVGEALLASLELC